MAFFTFKIDKERIKDYSGDGGKYINNSGIYEIILKNVIVDVTANGSEFLNLFFEYKGQDQIIFQAIRTTNNDKSPNTIGEDLLLKLLVICGATTDGTISDPVKKKLPIGKGGEEKECMVLEEFENTPMYIRIQMEYNLYNGSIQERKLVRNFFRYEDKATASEIINEVDKGQQYLKEEEHASAITYNNNLSPEDVNEWIKNGRGNNTKEASNTKPTNGFGGKRFGK